MRPLTSITWALTGVLVAPVVLWSLGLNPRWTIELHLIVFGIAVRLSIMASALAKRPRDVFWVGAFGGTMSSLIAQIMLHRPHDRANLAAVFSTYGAIGARMYQLDEITHWWPFVVSLGDGLVFGVLAIFAFRYVNRLQTWSPTSHL
jgi:hypothetical protein